MNSRRHLWLIFTGFLFLGLSDNPESPLVWHTNLDDAAESATKSGQHILLVFSGSDWCKNCMRLEQEVWQSQAFVDFARENLTTLRVDFPRKKREDLSEAQVRHNEHLAQTYNSRGTFPRVLLLDANKRVIATTGYLPGGAQKYIEHLQGLMRPVAGRK